MKIGKIISAVLSCSIACLSVASTSAMAANYDSPIEYNNIKTEESKESDSQEDYFNVFDIYNAYYEANMPTGTTPATTTAATTVTTTVMTTTTAETTTTATTPKTVFKGIDVSQWQGEIDWQKVAESGEVDYAIIKAGYGKNSNQVDPCFAKNMQGAKENNIDVGVYWFSYAGDVESAKQEAEACYQVIKDYTFEYPIYFDIEYGNVVNNRTIGEVSAIVDAFCSTLEEKGYYVGVYSYAYLLQTKMYENVLNKYDVWVAQYGSSSPYAYTGSYNMWQYSSTGVIDGITANTVDLNYCYKDYSKIIKTNPSPEFVKTTTAPSTQPTTTTTTAVCNVVNADKDVLDWGNISGSSFTMLAVNYTEEEPDGQVLIENISGARLNNRRIGLMWKADTLNTEEIIEDAEKLHTFIENMQIDYPVYLDITDSIITDSGLSSDEISELIRAFCSVFDVDRNHYIAIMGYDDFLTDNVNADIFEDYDVWLINEDDIIRFSGKYGIVSSPLSDGVYENFRSNRNYPSVMVAYHLNGF